MKFLDKENKQTEIKAKKEKFERMMKKLLKAPKKASTYFEKSFIETTPEKCSESTLSEDKSESAADDKNYYCDTSAYENHLNSIGCVQISAFSFDDFETESKPVEMKQEKSISKFTSPEFQTPATLADSPDEQFCSGFDSHFK